jgi:hypothetical protein
MLERMVGPVHMAPVPIAHDCTDGLLGAYWRRPESYLDAEIRSAISAFAAIDAEAGLARLRTDLSSGRWAERNRHLLALDALDVGYRLVSCEIGGKDAQQGGNLQDATASGGRSTLPPPATSKRPNR